MRTTSKTWELHDPVFASDVVDPSFLALPWGGHRRFAYDLILNFKPSSIVELGTHVGNSLMAFCQGVNDSQIQCRIFGIDTWVGDEHSGMYGEDVLETLQKNIDNHFSKIEISLIRSTFDQQLSHFKDGSIDILHIDGLHTYEACRHDFETWLPKLSKNGLVLLHDISLETGYGSARYWLEIADQFPSLAFDHSFGLGVIAPKGTKCFRIFDKKWKSLHLERYKILAENDLFKLQIRDLSEMIRLRDKTICRFTQTDPS